MEKRFFGTDGIRGRVGHHPITPEFCLRLGWAVGKVFSRQGSSHVLIGKDTRISGYMLESVLESGLVSAGADVSLMGPMPTPAVAYLTRTLRADAGIVISASHNPYYDNGIKFFDHDGNKLADDVELEIEAQLDRETACVESDRLGKAARIADAAGRYIEFCKATVNREFRLRGLKIVLDCAHGATYHVAPGVFEELGADIVVMGNAPNGTNINDGCGSTAPSAMAARVVETGADLGIAFDGDGDRVVMVDAAGELLDGDELLYIIARHRAERGLLRGGVVGTVMSNFGLEQALDAEGIPFCRARVGDRHVLEMMKARGWQLGGESSGHLVCLDLTTTGDAIVAALQALVPMVAHGHSLAELRRGMAKVPQVMINVPAADPAQRAASAAVVRAAAEADRRLAGRGRVLIRPSGTEPVVRVMVEGEDAEAVRGMAAELADAVRGG
ncbi:MAG: phosphoglucosamine mutase [Pseudomonadales bacterium]|uniref:phosphoglucosamine mutase n=1 Tax=Roseovarius sp. TaxID=1486281 RepID=UPI0032EDECB8